MDWTKHGGKAVLCVNNTSHLRPKGTEWNAVSVSNCDAAEVICNKLNAIFESGIEQVRTLKLYNNVYPRIYPKNDIGGFDKNPIELKSAEITDYVDDLNAIAARNLSNFNERGLMKYYRTNDSVDTKVKSVVQRFEVIENDVFYVTECDVTENLTDREIGKLKDYLKSHGENGFGRSVSLSGIKTIAGELYADVWSRDKNFEILTEEELAHKFSSKNLITERFYTPLSPMFFDRNNHMRDVTNFINTDAAAKILNKNCVPILVTEHYNDNYAEHDKVKSINQHYEAENGELIMVTECAFSEELTAPERHDLKLHLLGQMYDAYGEGVMKRDCSVSGKDVQIQIFGCSEDYELLTKAEFEQPQTQELDEEMSMNMEM